MTTGHRLDAALDYATGRARYHDLRDRVIAVLVVTQDDERSPEETADLILATVAEAYEESIMKALDIEATRRRFAAMVTDLATGPRLGDGR